MKCLQWWLLTFCVPADCVDLCFKLPQLSTEAAAVSAMEVNDPNCGYINWQHQWPISAVRIRSQLDCRPGSSFGVDMVPYYGCDLYRCYTLFTIHEDALWEVSGTHVCLKSAKTYSSSRTSKVRTQFECQPSELIISELSSNYVLNIWLNYNLK